MSTFSLPLHANNSHCDGNLRDSTARSERQHLLEKEHDEMMDKLNRVVSQDFDNTKRIERPEEVLARRRKEREARNAWYRRYWRYLRGQE